MKMTASTTGSLKRKATARSFARYRCKKSAKHRCRVAHQLIRAPLRQMDSPQTGAPRSSTCRTCNKSAKSVEPTMVLLSWAATIAIQPDNHLVVASTSSTIRHSTTIVAPIKNFVTPKASRNHLPQPKIKPWRGREVQLAWQPMMDAFHVVALSRLHRLQRMLAPQPLAAELWGVPR